MADQKRITIKEEMELTNSSPSAACRSLSEAYVSIGSNLETMHNVGQSLRKSLRKVCISSQTISNSTFNKTTVTTMSSNLKTVAECLKSASALAIYSRTLSSSQNNCKSVHPNIDLKPFIKAPAGQYSNLTFSRIMNTQVSEAMKNYTLRLTEFSSTFTKWFKSSQIFTTMTSVVIKIKQYLQKNVNPLLNKLRNLALSLRSLAFKTLLYLHCRWLKRRNRPFPFNEESFKKNIALRPIGPPASFEYFDFADRIRQTYLGRHRQISEDTDVYNYEYLLAC